MLARAYIAKAMLTDFFFGRFVFFPLLAFSLTYINNAGTFVHLLRWRKY